MSAGTKSMTGDSHTGGSLYVVATPIGNLADITLRAIETLKSVDLIAAEDTRHTQRLLSHHQIKNQMISLHEHNESQRTPDLIERLRTGDTIALVSNAGTPTLSDPGYRLVKEAAAAHIRVVPIPGPSAALASLSVSGLPTDAYIFIGFLPRKSGKANKILAALQPERKTLIFYESPRRIKALLSNLIQTMGDREAVLSREMTKRHEEFIRGSLTDIAAALSNREEIKGECTLVVHGFTGAGEPNMDNVRKDILQALRSGETTISDLAKQIAAKHGLMKKQVYSEALKIKPKVNVSNNRDKA
jgi:16S rRNA (cytidine1402-2'-O)-methyltransferase